MATTGKSPFSGLSGEDHILFKAKPCLEEEKSPLLVQSAKTEMGRSVPVMGTDLDSLVKWHHVAYIPHYKKNLSLCI